MALTVHRRQQQHGLERDHDLDCRQDRQHQHLWLHGEVHAQCLHAVPCCSPCTAPKPLRANGSRMVIRRLHTFDQRWVGLQGLCFEHQHCSFLCRRNTCGMYSVTACVHVSIQHCNRAALAPMGLRLGCSIHGRVKQMEKDDDAEQKIERVCVCVWGGGGGGGPPPVLSYPTQT